jgi:hypothetical protein
LYPKVRGGRSFVKKERKKEEEKRKKESKREVYDLYA